MAKSDLPILDKLDPAHEWQPWKPSKEEWNIRWAAHLWRRGGFGPSLKELRESAENGLDSTLNRLFSDKIKPLPNLAKIATQDPKAGAIELRAQWIQRMLSGNQPVREKLTYFWHNHFATSITKIQSTDLMKIQNDLLFKYALGKFGPFLREMSRDAAMLIWLDSNQNVKSHPNENYAREIMELFSLGVGNYTEKDIQEAARAFTGWHVTTEQPKQFSFVSIEHDFGKKTVLKQTGEWDGDDIIRILLEQKACAQFLIRKLYAFYVSEMVNPSEKFLEPLAEALRKSDYDISVPVKMILSSRHFFSEYAYRQKMKSPIEFCIGIGRMFGTSPNGGMVISPYSLIPALELMGQQLYSPPNVKGWEGGKAWLNTSTVLARHNFINDLIRGGLSKSTTELTGASFATAPDPLRILRMEGIDEPEKIVDFVIQLCLADELRPEVRTKLIEYIEKDNPKNLELQQRQEDVVYVMMTLPEYQLN
jgi:uncharacterized protein (DUF1800 family)